MAELLRSETNLKPSELKAAYKRSQHIDALLDKEREERQQEIQILTLGKRDIEKLKYHFKECLYLVRICANSSVVTD